MDWAQYGPYEISLADGQLLAHNRYSGQRVQAPRNMFEFKSADKVDIIFPWSVERAAVTEKGRAVQPCNQSRLFKGDAVGEPSSAASQLVCVRGSKKRKVDALPELVVQEQAKSTHDDAQDAIDAKDDPETGGLNEKEACGASDSAGSSDDADVDQSVAAEDEKEEAPQHEDGRDAQEATTTEVREADGDTQATGVSSGENAWLVKVCDAGGVAHATTDDEGFDEDACEPPSKAAST